MIVYSPLLRNAGLSKQVPTPHIAIKSESHVTVELISSFDEVSALRQEWDSFIESVFSDIYMTFDWCRIWWEHYGKNRQLRIFLIYREGELVGLLPFFLQTVWLGPTWLKMAKMVGSDFTTSMVNLPVRSEVAYDVFTSVIDYLITKEGSDVVWFGPTGDSHERLNKLRKAIDDGSVAVLFRDSVRAPYTVFQLPESFDEYINSLSKRQRGNLRRDLNLIDRSFTLTQDVVESEDATKSEFEKFVQMHTAQWKAEGRLGHFHDWPLASDFNMRMALAQAQQGRLRLVRLLADETVASYQLCYAFGNRWYWRLPARLVGTEWDKYALGRIGLIKEIEMALAEGVREIEAGAGHYDYKVKLGGKEYTLHTIMLVRKQWFCRWRAFLFANLSDFLHFCYYRAWFCRLAPKLPFKRRPLWKIWIRTRL